MLAGRRGKIPRRLLSGSGASGGAATPGRYLSQHRPQLRRRWHPLRLHPISGDGLEGGARGSGWLQSGQSCALQKADRAERHACPRRCAVDGLAHEAGHPAGAPDLHRGQGDQAGHQSQRRDDFMGQASARRERLPGGGARTAHLPGLAWLAEGRGPWIWLSR